VAHVRLHVVLGGYQCYASPHDLTLAHTCFFCDGIENFYVGFTNANTQLPIFHNFLSGGASAQLCIEPHVHLKINLDVLLARLFDFHIWQQPLHCFFDGDLYGICQRHPIYSTLIQCVGKRLDIGTIIRQINPQCFHDNSFLVIILSNHP